MLCIDYSINICILSDTVIIRNSCIFIAITSNCLDLRIRNNKKMPKIKPKIRYTSLGRKHLISIHLPATRTHLMLLNINEIVNALRGTKVKFHIQNSPGSSGWSCVNLKMSPVKMKGEIQKTLFHHSWVCSVVPEDFLLLRQTAGIHKASLYRGIAVQEKLTLGKGSKIIPREDAFKWVWGLCG